MHACKFEKSVVLNKNLNLEHVHISVVDHYNYCTTGAWLLELKLDC